MKVHCALVKHGTKEIIVYSISENMKYTIQLLVIGRIAIFFLKQFVNKYVK